MGEEDTKISEKMLVAQSLGEDRAGGIMKS